MTLLDILAQLDRWPDDATIYAFGTADAWSPATPAMVCAAPGDGSVPEEARGMGFRYFLEVYLAKEAVEVARQWFGSINVSPAQEVIAVIYYAEHDAYTARLPEPKPAANVPTSAWLQLHLPLE